MLILLSIFLLASWAGAAKHHMFVGTYGTSSIYSLAFDETAKTLTVVRNNTLRSENERLALSYNGKTLYTSGRSGWSSYNVKGPTELGPEMKSIAAVGTCNTFGGVFVIASKRAPYSVYGSLSCANSVSVSEDGKVSKAVAIPYNDTALIYGMAMDPTYSYLYSSDWKAGKIWTHKVDSDGSLKLVGSVDAPSSVSAPRSIVVHPSGKAMYVVLEAWNTVALYQINSTTHLPVYTYGLYTLVPNDAVAGNYASQSAVVSTKGTMLWATSRSKVPGKPGYMSGFSLSETGMINEALFQVITPTGGGLSNIVVSCPFSENLIALTETEKETVSIWKHVNRTAKALASVSIPDTKGAGSGCCSDAVWID